MRERIFELCHLELSLAQRDVVSHVIAQLGTPEAILTGLNLIRDHTNLPIPFALRQGIEAILVERRPYGGTGYAYTLEPRSSNEIIPRLYEMVLSDSARHQTAFALLGEIALWRLQDGKPVTESRHPAFESGKSWPPLEMLRGTFL